MIRAVALAVLVASASFGATTFLLTESWAWPLVVLQAAAWLSAGVLLERSSR